MRRIHKLLAAGIAGLVTAVVPVIALADWTTFPTPHSPNGQTESDLYRFITWPALIVFVLVELALVVSAIRYRRRRANENPPQYHGNTTLEIIWTVLPAIIIAIISIQAGLVLARDNDPNNFPTSQLDVKVTGVQWAWKYTFPRQGVETPPLPQGELTVPINEVVRLQFTSPDVIHGWWVPNLMGKTDAVPGYFNYNWFKADQVGTFKGGCTEFCGLNHAEMLISVKVVDQAAFKSWIDMCLTGTQKDCGPAKR